MNWIKVSVNTTADGIEPLSDRLSAVGLDALEIEDESDFVSFLENNKKYWDYVDDGLRDEMRGVSRVSFYLSDDGSTDTIDALPELLASLREARPDVDFGALSISLTPTKDDDWLTSWKKYYKPFKVGEKLYVKPEWETLDDNEGRVVYVSNPGLAFGSGIHETTRLCMRALETAVHGGEQVLDMGCGSGILSVTAVLLGAASAQGVDIDDKAADTSAANASLNGVADRCSFRAGDLTSDPDLINKPDGGFDIIVANIVADVIIALSVSAFSLLRCGGTFITSGIIDTRLDDVLPALRGAGFTVAEIKTDGGWCAVVCSKPVA